MSLTSFLTVADAARRLGVKHRAVRSWISRGELQAFRIPGRGGGEIRIREADVLALVLPYRPRRKDAA